MSPRLKISNCVIERLSKIDSDASIGCLYGLMYDGTLLVVSFNLELGENGHNLNKQLLLHLPTEVELCGVIKFGDITDNCLKDILQDVDITDNPLVIVVNQDKQVKAHFLVHNKFEQIDFEVLSSEDLYTQFLYVRLNTTMKLICEATINGVKHSMQSKRKKIASGQLSFHMDGTQVYLFGVAADVGVTGINNEATIGELVDSKIPEINKKKKYNYNTVDVVPVNLIMKATKDIISDKVVITAVKMMTTQKNPSYFISMPLNVDTLAMIHRNTKLIDVYSALVEAVCRSLKHLERGIVEQLDQEGVGDGAGLKLPETYHCLPEQLGHFITNIVPKDIPDESLEQERMTFHKGFALPTDRPLFRRGNSYNFHTNRPINPHESVSQPKWPINSLVRGRYAYYHYLQDQINDQGWGCAYRSLQTIASWFRYQGYTTSPVPSHRDIQQCLVDIQDKPTSFVGSKQWIGSTEVMFCLETLLGVTSRIIFANSGKELKDYALELVSHFTRHGSPVMIGGGVLAHTILGIDYNPDTEEVRYLILDPHYTGDDDLKVIVNKGWCGWKNNDFWDKNSHYNLCLPQTVPCI